MEYGKVLTDTCGFADEKICLTACVPQAIELQIFEAEWRARQREFNWCETVTIDLCIAGETLKQVSALRAIFDAYENPAQGIIIHKDSASGEILIDTVNDKIVIQFLGSDTCCFNRAALLVWSLVLIDQAGNTVLGSQGSLFVQPSGFALYQKEQLAPDGFLSLLLDFVQGKDFHRKFLWKNEDGTAIDFTGGTARLVVRDKLPANGGVILYDVPSGDGRLTVNPAGEVLLDLPPVDTAAMDWSRGVWELEVYLTGNVVKYLQGQATVKPEIIV